MKFNAANKQASNPHIIRLKDGESVTGVLRGDPYEYERAFKAGDVPKFRFRINIVVSENGALVAKILEGGWKLYSQLMQFHTDGWDLEKSYTKVSRTGSTLQNTVYSATVLPKPVDGPTLEKVSAVQLRDLSESGKISHSPSGIGTNNSIPELPPYTDEDIPF